jgi:peptidoglycan hydrolase CwlO-like protein
MNTDPSLLFSEYGSDITPTNYENLLRRYESDIRNYIKIENMLKIHIDELYYKIEQLEKNIELLKQKISDEDNNNIESYKKKIEELLNLIKLYEKSNL